MTPQGIIVCLLVGGGALLLAIHRLQASERRIVVAAFFAHVLATFALVVYHEQIFQGGDMLWYAKFGKLIAYVIDTNPGRWGLETVKLALQIENELPVEVLGAGTSTGTMSAFAGLIMFVVGDTIFGTCLLVSFFSFWGTVQLYRALRPKLEVDERIPVMAGLLLVPSVVFWTSGLVKEGVVVGCLGVICNSLSELIARRRIWALLPLVVAVEGIALTKPYVLVTLTIAMGGWFYAKNPGRFSFVQKLTGLAAVAVAIVVISSRFPEFSPARIAESVARSQQNYVHVAGAGSNIEIGDETAPRTIAGQLKWAPLGLLNSLLRPFAFEVRNGAMLLAALETTFLIVIGVRLVMTHTPRRIFREVRNHPALLFAAVLVLAFGTSVGLATKNLGTLSRYRVPMMPIYVAGALLLQVRLRRSERRAAPAAPSAAATGPRLARIAKSPKPQMPRNRSTGGHVRLG